MPEIAFVALINGVTLDPIDWNLSDGFSPGSPILAQAPHLDVQASGIAQERDADALLLEQREMRIDLAEPRAGHEEHRTRGG